ncbi:MAG TPA: ATP-binding protein [Burkholderiales bacterium]
MLEKFFGVACKIVESDYAALGLLDEGEKGFACLLTEGLDPGLYDRQYDRRLAVGLPYSLLAERRVFRQRAGAAAREIGPLPPGHPAIASFLGCPVASAGRAYGWIYFANKPGGRDFSDKDERLVATLADMLASLYELERQVKERTAELEAANRELEAFSYSVAHDFRAPLRHIDGFARMALEKSRGLDAALVKHLDTVIHAAGSMGRMIDGLLSLSRVGRAGLQRRPVDMAGLVEEARGQLGPEAARPALRWKIGALPSVRGDPELIRVVWINLLSNALKYSSRQPQPEIQVGAQTADDGKPVFFVRDNGVGFDTRYGGKLFNVFQRLHRRDEFEGVGIGLAIVRRAIERHGGRVWAESRINEGATFYFCMGEEPADTPEA